MGWAEARRALSPLVRTMMRPRVLRSACLAPFHSVAPALALAGAVALVFALAIWPRAATAQSARRIILRGSSRLELRAARKSAKLALTGRVLDDAGKPLPRVRVLLAIEHEGTKLPMASGSAEPCDHTSDRESGARQAPGVDDTGAVLAETNEVGRFCVRLLLPMDRYVAHAHVDATDLLDASDASISVDLGRAPLSLRFDPERTTLWLDGGSVSLVAAATSDDENAKDAPVALSGLRLDLSNEVGAALASAVTDDTGHVRFLVDGAKLGAPGKGELRIAFAGNASTTEAASRLPVERRVHVDLVIPGLEGAGMHLAPGSPEDGIELPVEAVLRCRKDGCVGNPTGAVEARLAAQGSAHTDDAIVGASALDGGRARVVAIFPMPPSTSARLRVRYTPDAPWFVAGDDLTIEQPLQPASPWRKVPLALAAILVVAVLVLARLPPRVRHTSTESAPPLDARPGVAVVREAPESEGWSGNVVDVHDGVPLAGVRVVIERPGMLGTEAMARAVSDEKGWFSLGFVAVRPGDELVAEGPLHAVLRRPLPPSGVLSVAVLQRKRALLNELVDWVRKRADVFTFRGEPTPGEVSAFAALFRQDVSEWADAVERAAYGGAPVDAATHEQVNRRMPAEPQTAHADGDLHKRRYRPGPQKP